MPDKQPLSSEKIREILNAGKDITDEEYSENCNEYFQKTFYLICQKLLEGGRDLLGETIGMSSSHLEKTIIEKIRPKKENPNPVDRFSQLWTFSKDLKYISDKTRASKISEDDANTFKDYSIILDRSETKSPYVYSIKSSYFDILRSIFLDIQNPNQEEVQDNETLDIIRDVIESFSDYDFKKPLDTEDTEKLELAKARIGQGRFRKEALKIWNYRCAVKGLSFPRLLIASHIKPWKDSTNQERLDPYNCLILSPSIDKAFDVGLITFSDNGEIQISGQFEHEVFLLGINQADRIKGLNDKSREYLKFHREHIFDNILKKQSLFKA